MVAAGKDVDRAYVGGTHRVGQCHRIEVLRHGREAARRVEVEMDLAKR